MTKRRPPAPALNPWQQHLLAGLNSLAAQQPADLRVRGRAEITPGGLAGVRISLHTADIPHAAGGLILGEDEEFLLVLPPTERLSPQVLTPHSRFAGTPHVLEGYRLCIYLDGAREWDPHAGMAGVLNRLWQWLADAAANRFDPAVALFHAVGGVLHRTPDTPTIVAREPQAHHTAHTGWLTPRSAHRLDLTGQPRGEHSLRLPVLPLNHSQPLGAGRTLADLASRIDTASGSTTVQQRGVDSSVLLTTLAHSARRNPEGTCQYFVLAVPHPTLPTGARFLLAGRLSALASDTLRTAQNLSRLPADVWESAIEWCYLSDERAAVTIRRDAQRPVTAFHNAHVHLWGCGGIGSWAAELIARAGAARITLSDPATPITGGLLVRQNYTEADVGSAKATALAQRLRSLRDDLIVDHCPPPPSPELIEAARQADLILDATVSVATGRFLERLARLPDRRAVLAQMATDTTTASHGLLTVSAPGTLHGPLAIDRATGQHVLNTPDLEPYHLLWTEPQSGEEITPTRGCSVPTFHGSAADLVGVTASLVTLLATQLHHPVSGTHLCAQPHTGTQPAYRFLPYTPHPDAPLTPAHLPEPASGHDPLLQLTSSVGT